MILFGEAFYCFCKSLNLSLKGSSVRFVPLIVIGGRYSVSMYHLTFRLGSGSMAYFLSFPQTVPTDDAKNHQ